MKRFDAVIFDMDGTLIEQQIDFAAIRAELGIAGDVGILEAIEQMSPRQRSDAEAKLLAHELRAAGEAALMPEARQTLDRIEAAGLKTALLTRNAAEAMSLILQRFDLTFDLTWSREQGPIKPEPDGVLLACDELGVLPARAACVGDFHYDVTAANAAGAVSVLLFTGERPDFADEADYVIQRLGELPTLLEL